MVTQINPFTGSVLQAPQAQRVQQAERAGLLQKAQDLKKNSALGGDRFEHQVEASEELSAIHDEEQRKQQKRRPPRQSGPADEPEDDAPPHIDVTA